MCMIGLLKGQILSKNLETGQMCLLAGSVGYEVGVSRRTSERLETGKEATLWIHTHVREDVLVLFGFDSEVEKNFFRLLLGMSGLGPKTALSLISEHGAERLAQLILEKEISQISEAPGVGKKLASRMVLELSSKVEKLTWLSKIQAPREIHQRSDSQPARLQLHEDLRSALLNLGFSPTHVKGTLEKLWDRPQTEQDGISFEVLLKSALGDLTARPRNQPSMETVENG